ncbi:MAG: PH domain-containing protein [Planctomycetales bacterium]
MSDVIQFRPTKALLLVWMISSAIPAVGLGTLAAGAAAARNIVPERFEKHIEGMPAANNPVEFGTRVGAPLFALLAVASFVSFFSTHYELADRYVTRKSGVLWSVKRLIPLEQITSIDVRQGPLERLLGFGQIWIQTASTGTDEPEEMLIGVRDLEGMKAELLSRSAAARASERGDSPSGRESSDDKTQTVLLEQILDVLRDVSIKLDHDNQEPGDQEPSSADAAQDSESPRIRKISDAGSM